MQVFSTVAAGTGEPRPPHTHWGESQAGKGKRERKREREIGNKTLARNLWFTYRLVNLIQSERRDRVNTTDAGTKRRTKREKKQIFSQQSETILL